MIDNNGLTGIFDDLNITGLNTKEGLASLDDDEELYLKVLNSYATHTPKYLENIRNYSDINAFRIAAHTMKGSGIGIGANELGVMAGKMEEAAKNNDLSYIETNVNEFISTAENLISAIASFIERVSSQNQAQPKPEKDAPDPEIISALKTAADNYDITSLKENIKELDKFNYISQPDLVKWLEEKIGKSEFEAIQERLENVASENDRI